MKKKTKKKGQMRGGSNSSSHWGTGGVAIYSWNPMNDFLPAWLPLEKLGRSEVFDGVFINKGVPFSTDLKGKSQRYLPIYVNNDGVIDGTDTFTLTLDPEDSSIGFSQETYILQESWDDVAGDVTAFGFSGVFNPLFGKLLPEESDLERMFLADENSKPLNTPKLVAGGRFSEITIIIEDAQSTTPPIQLDDNDNIYIVSDIADRPSTDAVYAGAGNDQIIGSDSERELVIIEVTESSIHSEVLMADHLFGEAGDDILRGGFSNDRLNGGTGNDLLFGEIGEDSLSGMMGDDILWGDYEENYKANSGDLNGFEGLPGLPDRDVLYGGAGNDALFGGAGADLLFGGPGIDYLSPGKKGSTSHPQILEGGSGSDRFSFYTNPWLFNSLEQTVDSFESKTSQEMTRITDFSSSEGDSIGIYVGRRYSSSFGFAELPINQSITADQFHTGLEAADESDRFIYNKLGEGEFSTAELYFDPDGTGSLSQVFLTYIEGSPALTHSDIITFDDSSVLPPSSNSSLQGEEIIGTDRSETLIGTEADDVIIGRGRSDRLTGSGGSDRFKYEALSDRIDRILDFETGIDKIDLSDLFNREGIPVSSFTQAVNDGYLGIRSFGRDNSRITIDEDGNGGRLGRSLAYVYDVTPTALNNANNFIV